MMKRDDVIMNLTEIADQPTTDGIVDGISQKTIREALKLLKEQEKRLINEYKRGYDHAWDEIGRR